MQKCKANTIQTIQLSQHPTVTGNNSNENSFSSETMNRDNNSFLSELIINENQSFVFDQLRKDDMTAANAKQTSKIHIYNNESFISDQYKDPHLEVKTIQKKKKRKWKKKKNKSKMDILESKSSDQNLNNDELAVAEIYSIADDVWGIKTCQQRVIPVHTYSKM